MSLLTLATQCEAPDGTEVGAEAMVHQDEPPFMKREYVRRLIELKLQSLALSPTGQVTASTRHTTRVPTPSSGYDDPTVAARLKAAFPFTLESAWPEQCVVIEEYVDYHIKYRKHRAQHKLPLTCDHVHDKRVFRAWKMALQLDGMANSIKLRDFWNVRQDHYRCWKFAKGMEKAGNVHWLSLAEDLDKLAKTVADAGVNNKDRFHAYYGYSDFDVGVPVMPPAGFTLVDGQPVRMPGIGEEQPLPACQELPCETPLNPTESYFFRRHAVDTTPGCTVRELPTSVREKKAQRSLLFDQVLRDNRYDDDPTETGKAQEVATSQEEEDGNGPNEKDDNQEANGHGNVDNNGDDNQEENGDGGGRKKGDDMDEQDTGYAEHQDSDHDASGNENEEEEDDNDKEEEDEDGKDEEEEDEDDEDDKKEHARPSNRKRKTLPFAQAQVTEKTMKQVASLVAKHSRLLGGHTWFPFVWFDPTSQTGDWEPYDINVNTMGAMATISSSYKSLQKFLSKHPETFDRYYLRTQMAQPVAQIRRQWRVRIGTYLNSVVFSDLNFPKKSKLLPLDHLVRLKNLTGRQDDAVCYCVSYFTERMDLYNPWDNQRPEEDEDSRSQRVDACKYVNEIMAWCMLPTVIEKKRLTDPLRHSREKRFQAYEGRYFLQDLDHHDLAMFLTLLEHLTCRWTSKPEPFDFGTTAKWSPESIKRVKQWTNVLRPMTKMWTDGGGKPTPAFEERFVARYMYDERNPHLGKPHNKTVAGPAKLKTPPKPDYSSQEEDSDADDNSSSDNESPAVSNPAKRPRTFSRRTGTQDDDHSPPPQPTAI